MDPGKGRETRKESFGERRARKEGSGEPEKREGRGGGRWREQHFCSKICSHRTVNSL
jgi:hypothetical protein